MKFLRAIRSLPSYVRTFVQAVELAAIVVLYTACPPDPPPDDRVPVTPPHADRPDLHRVG